MHLKYCEQKDVDLIKSKYVKEIELFVHKTDDSLFKNFSIWDFVKDYEEERGKVLDCGAANSALCLLLSDVFDRVEVVDRSVVNGHDRPNLFKFIEDFYSYLEKQEDNSYDVITDACSITHFEYNEEKNVGWQKAASLIKRKLKDTGIFITSTDVKSPLLEQENNLKQYIEVPEIVDIFFREGLILLDEFDSSSANNDQIVKISWNGKEDFVLNYANLIFVHDRPL